MSTTELVANLGSATLSQKYFDDAGVVIIVRYHYFVDIARLYAAFKPVQQQQHWTHGRALYCF